MRIAVNTRWLLLNKLEGIGTFTHELMQRITQNHPEVQFDFYFDRPFDSHYIYGENVKGYRLLPPARHPYLWYVWYEMSIKRKLAKTKPDLFFSPDGFIPTSTKTKTLNTLHDLNFEHYPEWIPNFAIGYYKKYFPLCAKKANHLVTVSEFSKRDIVSTYKIEPDKIDVVYNAAEPQSAIEDLTVNQFKKDRLNEAPYFIFIGALNPRKNLQRIFPAFDRLDSDYKLLVVGEKMHWDLEIAAAFDKMKRKDQVIFSGRLEKQTLNLLLAGADGLIFPSLFEGFGIPIIEAFNAGTAVITSDITSMPEIAEDAALLVN
ncbi:MAG: glycosyltransferase family 4 protein, partial [Schleiferiaceae bacterium]|nr:glycosyltransferase family 4 protein [Schleiferiaceae bacterium]